MKLTSFLIGAGTALLSLTTASAAIKMPAIFGDHMVLQQNIKLPVWGWGAPGEKVTVTLGAETGTATADANGNWRVDLAPVTANATPQTLTVAGTNTVTFQDVLVGDVWLASGQSNMEYGMGYLGPEASANENEPQVRLFCVVRNNAPTAQKDLLAPTPDGMIGKWQVASPATLPKAGIWNGFSAVGYYFGREIQHTMKYPVGMIDSTWGGTPVQAWTGGAGLYNGMILPLIPFAIKGAIWYQGEANAGNIQEAEAYSTNFPNMITGWQKAWGRGVFPFLFVQLAGFGPNLKPPAKDPWPYLRESQVKTLSLPNTGMASAIDIGDPNNVHPRDKLDVGLRLALAAKHVAYGQDLVYSGPTYDSMEVQGGKVAVSFKNVGGGLKFAQTPYLAPGVPTTPPTAVEGFEIAGADKHYSPAQAVIDGDKVIVSSDKVPAPVAVRYGWANYPTIDLYNKEGLPAVPFRTEHWD